MHGRIFGGYEDPAHQFFVRIPEVLHNDKEDLKAEHGVSWRRRPKEAAAQQGSGGQKRAASRQNQKEDKLPGLEMNEIRTRFGRVMQWGLWLAQSGAVSTCMALSCTRLIKHDYVDTQYMQQDQYRNIKRSLNIFYGLVLAQGTIFTIMQYPLIGQGLLNLRKEYMLYSPSGREIVYRYKNDNYMEFIMGNVRPTLNMDLVTFAKNLALSSSIDDKLLGVRTIDNIFRSATAGDKPISREQQILARLQASLNPEELFSMLGLTINIDEEEDIRGHAARLLLQLALLLPVDSFSKIQHLISSLLSAENKDTRRRDMDLVWFGLRMLDKLTDNPEFCRQAKDCDDLLSKIIGLTNLCGHAHATTCGSGGRNSESWMENEVLPLLLREEEIPTSFQQRIDEEIVAAMSLNVLGKLVAAPGEAGKELRRKTIDSAHFHFHFHSSTRTISPHVEAARVISCLALDDKPRTEVGRSPQIIKMLKNCLLPKTQHVNMTSKVAAKLLLLEYASSEQLQEIQLLRNHILENQSSSLPPMLVIIEEVDLEYVDAPRWVINRIIQRLDLKDLLSAPRVNSAEAAAQALVMLTTGSTCCQGNIEAILEELDVEEELQVIVNMLSAEYGEKKEKHGGQLRTI